MQQCVQSKMGLPTGDRLDSAFEQLKGDILELSGKMRVYS